MNAVWVVLALWSAVWSGPDVFYTGPDGEQIIFYHADGWTELDFRSAPAPYPNYSLSVHRDGQVLWQVAAPCWTINDRGEVLPDQDVWFFLLRGPDWDK